MALVDTFYFIFYILYFIFYILYFVFCILYFVFYILYFVFCILYFIFYILYFLRFKGFQPKAILVTNIRQRLYRYVTCFYINYWQVKLTRQIYYSARLYLYSGTRIIFRQRIIYYKYKKARQSINIYYCSVINTIEYKYLFKISNAFYIIQID